MKWRRWCALAIIVALISGFVFFLTGGPPQADFDDGARFGLAVRCCCGGVYLSIHRLAAR